MAASPVLADSSFYIGLLRQQQDPLRALALAAASRDLVICGVIRCEVGRALRHQPTRERFRQFWDVMINVPTDARLWDAAEELLWTLDRRGQIIPLTDAVIACSALRIGATILTHDKHFDLVPGLRVVDRLDV